MVRPITMLPESPKKMLAGGRLYTRKPASGGRQGQGHDRHVILSLAGGDDAQHGGGRQAHDRRQPVHAVEQIQGVDAADQPQDRQRDAQPTQFDRIAEGDNAANVVFRQNDRQHREDLQSQLQPRGEIEAVVHAADEADEAGGEHPCGGNRVEPDAGAGPRCTASSPSTVAP